MKNHSIDDLITLFDTCFFEEFNTRLIRGTDEPIYLPANIGDGQIGAKPYAQIVFAHGFYASAMHEIAHWCLAGEARRKQLDYGYWYSPDGRTSAQQLEFQSVEIKPQAIEWGLSASAGFMFSESCDNLSGDEFGQQPDRIAFKRSIQKQSESYLQKGFPKRAAMFMKALSDFYGLEPVTSLEQLLSCTPPIKIESDNTTHEYGGESCGSFAAA